MPPTAPALRELLAPSTEPEESLSTPGWAPRNTHTHTHTHIPTHTHKITTVMLPSLGSLPGFPLHCPSAVLSCFARILSSCFPFEGALGEAEGTGPQLGSPRNHCGCLVHPSVRLALGWGVWSPPNPDLLHPEAQPSPMSVFLAWTGSFASVFLLGILGYLGLSR